MMKSSLFLFTTFSFIISTISTACYFPDGSPASGYFQCNSSSAVSVCCQSGWTCMSNDLCVVENGGDVSLYVPVGTTMRGACSSIPWVTSVCGSLCLGPSTVDNGTLTACGDDTYCCDNDVSSGLCNCTSGGGAQSVAPGIAETTIGVFGILPSPTSSTSSASFSNSSMSTVTNSPTSLVATSTRMTSSVTSMSTSPTPSSNAKGLSKGAKIGVGIGASIGGIAVLGLLVFLYFCCFGGSRGGGGGGEGGHYTDVGDSRPSMTEDPFRRPNPVYVPQGS